MSVLIVDHYSIDLCRHHPDSVFVFGDNLDRHGRGGQAVIRYEPNVFGVPTKRFATMHESAFFSDKPCERNHVLEALRTLWTMAKNRDIIFPSAGLGTGLAKMPEKSPLIFAEMCEILLKHFSYRNGQ